MDSHEEFFRSLPSEEKNLIALKQFLYEGSWEELIADLKARMEGKPHVFKLATRIEEDLARIEKLKEYEEKTGINLGEYLHLYKGSKTG